MLLISKAFHELSALELYRIIQARQDVFCLEQKCLYRDLDDLDLTATHLWMKTSTLDLVAYLRILPPGTRFPEWSVGRVLTLKDFRNQGYAKTIVQEALRRIPELAGSKQNVRISAQSYLEKFYSDFGFIRVGEEYLEDNIPHIEMLKI